MAKTELKYLHKKYLELEEEMLERLNKRRSTESMSQVVYIKRGPKVKTPVKKYESQTPYIFLQYLRIVMQWAKKKLGASSLEVELLLYLYPIGIFNNHQLRTMCNTLDMYSFSKIGSLSDKGLIKIWRNAKEKQPALYCLTRKSTKVISKMHTVLVGEDKLPETEFNPILSEKKTMNRYYLRAIKEMNSKVG